MPKNESWGWDQGIKKIWGEELRYKEVKLGGIGQVQNGKKGQENVCQTHHAKSFRDYERKST